MQILFLLPVVICALTACASLSGADVNASLSIINSKVGTSKDIKSNTIAQTTNKIAYPSWKKSNKSEEASSTRSLQMMSSHLSSRAKRAILLSSPDEVLTVMLTIGPKTSRDELTAEIEQAGGAVMSWSKQTNLVNANLPVGALESISKRKDVHYVETGGRYGKN